MATRDTTVVRADGTTVTATPVTPAKPNSRAFDCFYVYPTVSNEQQPNDDLDPALDAPELAAAVAQASPFSQVCNLWAPLYQQATRWSETMSRTVRTRALDIAYRSLHKAWDDYLHLHNKRPPYTKGRPIILLGHSQGSRLLFRLLRDDFDTGSVTSTNLLHQLVSAIIPGEDITVTTTGKIVTLKNIYACRSGTQVGCLIAYSSYPYQPPSDSRFGRASTTTQVLCTNPAALTPGSPVSLTAGLDSYFPVHPLPDQKGAVLWREYPDLFHAECRTKTIMPTKSPASWSTVSWLQVSKVYQIDPRLQLQQELGPDWGYHVYDINLALGNLIEDVVSQEKAYCPTRPGPGCPPTKRVSKRS